MIYKSNKLYVCVKDESARMRQNYRVHKLKREYIEEEGQEHLPDTRHALHPWYKCTKGYIFFLLMFSLLIFSWECAKVKDNLRTWKIFKLIKETT